MLPLVDSEYQLEEKSLMRQHACHFVNHGEGRMENLGREERMITLLSRHLHIGILTPFAYVVGRIDL